MVESINLHFRRFAGLPSPSYTLALGLSTETDGDSKDHEDSDVQITDLGSAGHIKMMKERCPYNNVAKFSCAPAKSRLKLCYNWESYGDYAFYTNLILKDADSAQILI